MNTEVSVNSYEESRRLKLWCFISNDEIYILMQWFFFRMKLSGQYPWHSVSLASEWGRMGRRRTRQLLDSLVKKEILTKGNVSDINPLHRDSLNPGDRSFYTISNRMRKAMRDQGIIKRVTKVAP